jgi:hypothetical protein
MFRAAFLALAAISTAAPAAPLTIKMGESWAFAIENAQPAHAHRVASNAKPARGEIKATLRAVAGTTMTLTNNSATAFTYRAELVGTSAKARTCALPANNQPSLEYWPQKATAVILGDFKPTKDAGNCPPGK